MANNNNPWPIILPLDTVSKVYQPFLKITAVSAKLVEVLSNLALVSPLNLMVPHDYNSEDTQHFHVSWLNKYEIVLISSPIIQL